MFDSYFKDSSGESKKCKIVSQNHERARQSADEEDQK